jgi:carboxylate-amine ligase
MVYFDVRPSQRFETLEVRVADVGLTVDDAVLLGGLTRALVRTAATAAAEERPFPRWRPELLRGAHWRAARWGMTTELVSPVTGRPAPADEVVDALLDHVRPALEESGDLDEVTALVEQVRGAGTGAERQRAAFARRWTFDDVLAMAVEATVS